MESASFVFDYKVNNYQDFITDLQNLVKNDLKNNNKI